MNYRHRKIIEIAQEFGYTTASQFANFLKSYRPTLKVNANGKESIYLALSI